MKKKKIDQSRRILELKYDKYKDVMFSGILELLYYLHF